MVKRASRARIMCDHEQIYWSTIATRAVTAEAPGAASKAVRAMPELQRFFPCTLEHEGAAYPLHSRPGALQVGAFSDVLYNDLCEFARERAHDLAATREETEAEAAAQCDLSARDRKRGRSEEVV